MGGKSSAGVYRHPKTGIYWVRFRYRGVEYRRTTRERNPRAAAAAARQIRADIEATAIDRHQRRASLEELSAIDLAEITGRQVTDGHYKSQFCRWAKVLGVLSPTRDITQVDRDALNYYEYMRRQAGVRGQSIRKEFACLRRAWRIAIARGYVEGPIPAFPSLRSDAPDESKAGKRWPVELIQQYLSMLHADARDEIEFAALTGLRIGEIKRVQASWLEPTTSAAVPAFLSLPPSGTKTRDARRVPLTAAAYAIVQRRAAAVGHNDVPIFSQSDYKKHRARVSRSKKNGLGLASVITPRDMRHTFASLAIEGSGDPTAVMRTMGHRDLRMLDRYLSSTSDRQAAVANAVAGQIAGTRSGITAPNGPQKSKVSAG